MSAQNEDNSPTPSEEELQKRATQVFWKVKLFYAALGLGAIVGVTIGGLAVYQSFGLPGLVVGAIALIIALVMIGRWLLSF